MPKYITQNTVKTGGKYYPPGNELVVDDKTAEWLLETGAIKLLDEEQNESGEKATEEYTIQELKDYAEKAGIDLSGLSLRDDILNAVLAGISGQ